MSAGGSDWAMNQQATFADGASPSPVIRRTLSTAKNGAERRGPMNAPVGGLVSPSAATAFLAHSNVAPAACRVIGRPFQPGQSGNPSGRPRSFGLARTVRRRYGPNAEQLLDALDAVLRSHKVSGLTKVRAIELLLAYGWGRPDESDALRQTAVAWGREIALAVKARVSDPALLRLLAQDLRTVLGEDVGPEGDAAAGG